MKMAGAIGYRLSAIGYFYVSHEARMSQSDVQQRAFRRYLLVALGMGAAILYGGLTRFLFGQQIEFLGTLSLSFFGLTPLVLGVLTILLASEQQKGSWGYVIFAPWGPCSACMVLAGILNWEAWFCIALALPLFWLLASVGGVLGYLISRIAKTVKSKCFPTTMLICFMLSPYLAAPIEQLFPARTVLRTVHSQIVINSAPAVIWPQITNLQPIQPSEEHVALFHILGLPRPRAARMTCTLVGCLRTGQWENGLAFEGTVTKSIPERMYWLTLKADTQAVQPSQAPLDQIGGAVFSMVDDGYVIEDRGNGQSILHLYSTYRLTSRINGYATIWLDLLLQDIQRYILQIEQQRCEAARQ
jgi:hypothetical protein